MPAKSRIKNTAENLWIMGEGGKQHKKKENYTCEFEDGMRQLKSMI